MIKKLVEITLLNILLKFFNIDTNKLKYIIATCKVIQVDCELNPESDNIIQCYDNLKDALTAYEK